MSIFLCGLMCAWNLGQDSCLHTLIATGDPHEDTPDPAADPRNTAGWKHGEDRDAREAALQTELMRYMIRTDPLGMDRHHQRYWHMQVQIVKWFLEARWLLNGTRGFGPLYCCGIVMSMIACLEACLLYTKGWIN